MAAGRCAPWSRPPRSISASTGATSISSSMSARRRAPRGCCSASAAPTTAWTSPRAACWCRPTASRCWNAAPRSMRSPANAQDTPPLRTGALDVLAQHVLGCACGVPFRADELYAEVTTAAPYAALDARRLRRHGRFRRDRRLCAEILRALRQDQADQGRQLAHRASARRAACTGMNVGTIVEADMLKVRLVRSRASKRDPARRAAARAGRGIFHRDA